MKTKSVERSIVFCKLCTNPAGVADFFAEAASSEFMSFVGSMLALECVLWISVKRSLNNCHARSASVLTAHKCTRQRGAAQHFLSMDSIVNERPVVVLDNAQVISQNLQLLNPDLDIEPVEIVLLQVLHRAVPKEDEPSPVLLIIVVRLRQDGDATMSART